MNNCSKHTGQPRGAALLLKEMIRQLGRTAHKDKRKVGICGQAPSDHPEFAAFLVEAGIDSISLNPDSVIGTIHRVAKAENPKSKSGKT